MVPRNKGTMKNTSIDLYLWEEISQSLFRLGGGNPQKRVSVNYAGQIKDITPSEGNVLMSA
jgi:hypothetical protein